MGNMVKSSIFANKVFNDIGNRQFKYVYFNGYWQDERGQSHAAYEKQQGVLDSEWKSAVGQTNHINIENGLSRAREKIMLLQKDAESTEYQLLKQMKYTGPYNELSNSEKIKLWTNIFLFDSKDGFKIWDSNNMDDVRVAFALFINSTEFITKYRSSIVYSELSSTSYGLATGKDMSKNDAKTDVRTEFIDMLSKPSTNAYRDFRGAVVLAMEEYFQDSGLSEGYIKEAVREAFTETRDFISSYKERANKYNYSKDTIYERVKKSLKSNMEEMLRNSYDAVKKKSEQKSKKTGVVDTTYETWKQTHLVDDMLESLKIKMNNGDKTYIVMEITPLKKVSNAYKTKPGASAGAKRYSFIRAVTQLEEELSKNQSILTMGFIKNMKLEGADYWNCVSTFINTKLKDVVNNIFGDNCKFFTQDWNASAMTGMLGELSTYLTHGKNLNDLSLSGTTIDKFTNQGKGLSLGESFKDLTFFFNGQKYGINVKRYTTQERDSFTLYSDNEGIGINSQYMYRYFTPDEVKLIRFVALNRDFIVKNLNSASSKEADDMMINLYQSLSLGHLDNFIRLSSAMMGTINLFYVINNLTIPASVIYDYILKTLFELDKAKLLFNVIINNTPDAEDLDISEVNSLPDLPNLVDESNNLLKNSIKIKFKGLTLTELGQIFK